MNQIQTHQSRVFRRSILKILKVIFIISWITFKVIRWGQIQLLQPKNDQDPGGNGVKQVFSQPGNIRRSHQNIVLLSLSADCCEIELDYQ